MGAIREVLMCVNILKLPYLGMERFITSIGTLLLS